MWYVNGICIGGCGEGFKGELCKIGNENILDISWGIKLFYLFFNYLVFLFLIKIEFYLIVVMIYSEV